MNTARLIIATAFAAAALVSCGNQGDPEVIRAQETAEAQMTVEPPDRATPGRVLIVSGTGCVFMGEPTVEVFVRFFAHNHHSDFSTTLPVNDDGSFSGELVAPADLPVDQYTGIAECQSGDQLFPSDSEVPYIIDDAPRPTLTSAPATLQAGERLEVAGTNCLIDGTSLETTTISLIDSDGATVATTETTVGTDGSWGTSLDIPEQAAGGEHTVRARCVGPEGSLQPLDGAVIVEAASTTTPTTLSTTASTLALTH